MRLYRSTVFTVWTGDLERPPRDSCKDDIAVAESSYSKWKVFGNTVD